MVGLCHALLLHQQPLPRLCYLSQLCFPVLGLTEEFLVGRLRLAVFTTQGVELVREYRGEGEGGIGAMRCSGESEGETG